MNYITIILIGTSIINGEKYPESWDTFTYAKVGRNPVELREEFLKFQL